MYKTHINQICSDNNIQIIYRNTNNARANRKKRIIKIREIKSSITYAIALHEIGHILGKSTGIRLVKEANAWEWAKNNALVWNKSMNKKMIKCLHSYYEWAKRKEAICSKCFIPKTDHIFWKLYKK